MKLPSLAMLLLALPVFAAAQTSLNNDYRLALVEHKGQLRWSADGFKVVQNSAKPHGEEIGIRGSNASGISFLGFLFLVPEGAPMTSAKCRDGALQQEMKGNPGMKIIKTSEIARPGGLPVALATYTTPGRNGATAHMVRGFIATGDLCGDLEFYGNSPAIQEDPLLRRSFESFELDPSYSPRFGDLVMYAQVLFQSHSYPAAAPVFEKALAMVPETGAPFASATTARRVMRDQAVMSYGISGQGAKARDLIEKGIAQDPDYPMNYYNLACADAGENKLEQAKIHLKQAFDRKANMIAGEPIPNPTKDDSFLPYKANRDFWAFLEHLEASK